ncbi:alkaline phosphatase [Balneolales bacterium ANBcel1]|nr:alkaline phosphatase [Balneolales bacterium ANBcel1]
MRQSDQKKNGSFNRRDFLKTGALSGLFIGSGAFVTGCSPQSNGVARPGDVKNIIFMVSDGMSSGTLAAADQLLRRNYGRPSSWISLYESGKATRGLMDMASASSVVTCSAAASSSWGCGQRVNNGRVNMTEDGEPLTPILKIFRDAGKATGLATTTTITHATPAGFGANVMERGDEQTIAVQYLERGYDLLLGGGHRHLAPDRREDGRDLYAEFAEAGYRIARTKQEMQQGENSKKLLGVFYNGHLPYNLNHINTEEYRRDIPTLAEMTETALAQLSGKPNGFILQVEGGRVDHAAHGNDAAGLVYDQIAFDDAVAKAVAFAEGRDDTLVIITTDHGNANPGLSGTGAYYNDSGPALDQLADFRYTNSWMLRQLNENSSVSSIRETVEYASGIAIGRDEAEILRKAFAGDYQNLNRGMSRPAQVMGQIFANYLAFNWVSGAHTADYVELAAMGPGSEKIGAFTRNTDLFHLMVELAGVQQYAEV